MQTLLDMLGVEHEKGMTLIDWEWGAGEWLPLWLAVVLLALGVTWAVLIYCFEKGTIGWGRRIVGMVLRSTVIGLIIWMLLQPTLRLQYRKETPQPIALMLDNSQSLTLEDRRVTQEDKARALVAREILSPLTDLNGPVAKKAVAKSYKDDPKRVDILKNLLKHGEFDLIETMAAKGTIVPLLVGSRLHGLGDDGKDRPLKERLLGAVKADEAQTRLADSLMEVLQRQDADLPAAIVLFTDGIDPDSRHTLRDVVDRLDKMKRKVPIHVVGLGAAKAGLLRLRQVQLPDTIFTEDLISLPVHFKSRGLDKGTLEISATLAGATLKLKRDGKDVDKIEIPAPEGDDVRETLTFELRKEDAAADLKDLAITIKLRGDKKYQDTFAGKVRVADDKLKVLYIETAPRFQYKFLQQALLRDRRVDPTFLLINADKESTRAGPFISELPKTRKEFFDAKYNVIILGDVAPKIGDKGFLTEEQMGWIEEFVQKRGGLIAIAGPQSMPSAYVGTSLEVVLPVVVAKGRFKKSDPDLRTQEYPATLTEIGLRRASMLALGDTPEENQKIWQGLPGFHWHYPIEKLRAGAESLLVNPRVKMGDEPMPILATHYYSDQGQVLFVGSDETWRWRYNVEDKHFGRFWGQVIIELGKPTLGKNDRRAQLELGGAEAVLGKETRIYARLLDKDFKPLEDKEIEAKVAYIDPAGKKEEGVNVKFFRQKDKRYLASLNPDRPGRYEVTLTKPETTTFGFRVEPPANHELQPTALNEEGLKELARDSGGRYYREEDLRYLGAELKGRSISSEVRREILFWNWMVFVVFVVVLTSEWLLRKFSNLS